MDTDLGEAELRPLLEADAPTPDWLVERVRRTSPGLADPLGECARRLTRLALHADRLAGAAPALTADQAWRDAFDLWAPLLGELRLDSRRAFLQGISGPQGSGKSTLGAALVHLLRAEGRAAAVVSLDDFYLPWAERRKLKKRHPELRWRGPPLTHDATLALRCLRSIRQRWPTELPRFDKAARGGQGDRAGSVKVDELDVLFFEGWFVGATPVKEAELGRNPDGLERLANASLGPYLLLWRELRKTWVLTPTDARAPFRWREEAESARRATGQGAMTEAEVEQFVAYFQRALPPARYLEPIGGRAAVRVELDDRRRVTRLDVR